MKYYKITNLEEKRRNMQYQTGLNVNVESFKPYEGCKGGGLYFTGLKEILLYLHFGCWIREVTIPEGEEIYVDSSGGITKYKAHRIILGERKKIDAEVIRELIEEGADVHVDGDYPLRWACVKGHYDIAKLLLEYGADVHSDDDWTLGFASSSGNIELVKLLLEHGADVHEDGEWALIFASSSGYIDIVKILIEYGVDISNSLRLAKCNGLTDVVELLESYSTSK